VFCRAADIFHDGVDFTALLAYGTGEGISILFHYLEVTVDYLSHALYWIIIALGYVVRVVLTVGSVIVGIGAVLLGAIGIYLALVFDPNMLRRVIPD